MGLLLRFILLCGLLHGQRGTYAKTNSESSSSILLSVFSPTSSAWHAINNDDVTTADLQEPTTQPTTAVAENGTTKMVMTIQLFLKLASQYESYQINYALNTYMLITVIVLGVIGNVLSLLVMTQKHNRDHPLCIYMIGLALNDLSMLTLAFYSWVQHEFVQRGLAHWECQSGVYFFSVFSVNGVSIITVMTMERFMAVRHPLHAAVSRSVKRAYLTLCGLAIFSVVFTVPMWLYSRTLANNLCQAFVNTDVFSIFYSWAYLTVNCFLPFSVILVLNAFIIQATRRSRRFRVKSAVSQKSSTPGSDLVSDRATSMTTTGSLPTSASGVPVVCFEMGTQTELSLSVSWLNNEFKNSNGRNGGEHPEMNIAHNPKDDTIDNGNVLDCDLHVDDSSNTQSNMNSDSNTVVVSPTGISIRVGGGGEPAMIGGTTKKAKLKEQEVLSNRERQLTVMLVLVSLALLVLTGPQCVRYVMTNLYSFTQSPKVFADFMLFYSATNKIFFINNSINFYLYCLSGTRFRRDIRNLFSKAK